MLHAKKTEYHPANVSLSTRRSHACLPISEASTGLLGNLVPARPLSWHHALPSGDEHLAVDGVEDVSNVTSLVVRSAHAHRLPEMGLDLWALDGWKCSEEICDHRKGEGEGSRDEHSESDRAEYS